MLLTGKMSSKILLFMVTTMSGRNLYFQGVAPNIQSVLPGVNALHIVLTF